MNRAAALTKREFQMAEMLAWGAAKKEVADKLCVSTRTVETTARNIYQDGRTIIIDRKLAIELLK